MPGYKTHDRIAYIAAPVISIGVYYITDPIVTGTVTLLFLLSNHYLSPDLDIDSIMHKRWGMLYFIWIPYKKVFHHRSFWTHSGPISAAVRFLYLLGWLAPILYFLHPPMLFYVFLYVAMALADIVHTTADYIV